MLQYICLKMPPANRSLQITLTMVGPLTLVLISCQKTPVHPGEGVRPFHPPPPTSMVPEQLTGCWERWLGQVGLGCALPTWLVPGVMGRFPQMPFTWSSPEAPSPPGIKRYTYVWTMQPSFPGVPRPHHPSTHPTLLGQMEPVWCRLPGSNVLISKCPGLSHHTFSVRPGLSMNQGSFVTES